MLPYERNAGWCLFSVDAIAFTEKPAQETIFKDDSEESKKESIKLYKNSVAYTAETVISIGSSLLPRASGEKMNQFHAMHESARLVP